MQIAFIAAALALGSTAYASPSALCAAALSEGHRLGTTSNSTITRPLAVAACHAVIAEAEAVGLDPALVVAVAVQESHWRPNAASRSGARGLLQSKPYHCGTYLGHPCRDVDDHTRAGVRYLAHMVARGGVGRGLAAYRCGWVGSSRDDAACTLYEASVLRRARRIGGRA